RRPRRKLSSPPRDTGTRGSAGSLATLPEISACVGPDDSGDCGVCIAVGRSKRKRMVTSGRKDLLKSAWAGVGRRGSSVVKECIRLRGISDEIKGKVWEHDSVLRAGRLASLEIVLDDSSVSRKHAELRYAPPQGWVVRDLDSTNGTYVNGVRVAGSEKSVHARDIVQFGKVALVVELSEIAPPPSEPSPPQILVEAAANSSWEDAIQDLIFDRN